MNESLLVALISGFCTLAGSCAGVLASSRLTQYRLEQLEKRVAQHNNLIERTYRLEEQEQLLEERIKVANHRIEDLEHKA